MASDWLKRLVKQGIIGADQLREAEDMARAMGIKPEEVLVKNGYATADQVGRALAAHFNYPYVDLEGTEIPSSVIELVPESVARENIVCPLSLQGEALMVAISDPLKFEVIEKLQFILNREIRVSMAPKEAIQGAINR